MIPRRHGYTQALMGAIIFAALVIGAMLLVRGAR